jgi:hypothetical protein
METEKPQKRLVHMEQYLLTLGTKSALYSSAAAIAGVGSALLLTALLLSWFSFQAGMNEIARFLLSLANGTLATLGCGAMWAAYRVFRRARQIEPVAPITVYNANQLPAAETLMRASECPVTEHRYELLRPAGHGQETSPEQLLRSTQGEVQDF